MKSSLRTKLESLAHRIAELDAVLSSPDAMRDLDRYRALTRERAEIEPVVARFREYEQAEGDLAAAQEMARDPEMKAFADEEHAQATARMAALEADLQRMLLPKDPNDERNVFVEIRAGTGGDESALFAGSLCRMYTRYAERKRWQVEIVSESQAELGGYKEVIMRIVGQGAYSKLKFESGGHRVQRVPGDRGAGAHPHVRVHGRRDAGGRSRSPTSTSIRPTCASTRSARRAPAASTSTRPIPRCASRTCRPASSSNARTTGRSTATARRRWRCSRRGCSTASAASGSRRRRRCARR